MPHLTNKNFDRHEKPKAKWSLKIFLDGQTDRQQGILTCSDLRITLQPKSICLSYISLLSMN